MNDGATAGMLQDWLIATVTVDVHSNVDTVVLSFAKFPKFSNRIYVVTQYNNDSNEFAVFHYHSGNEALPSHWSDL